MKLKPKSLHQGDCLAIMKSWYNDGLREFINLCYIDPPFNSNRNYNVIFKTETDLTEEAFKDTWSDVNYVDQLEDISKISPSLYNFLDMLDKVNFPKSHITYLTIMAIRCWYIREMLNETGSFFYHCDPTMSHYVKAILDFIFGRENFRNEFIWCYTGPSSPGMKQFAKKHDVIFWYSKGSKWTFNVDSVRLPYKESTLANQGRKTGFTTGNPNLVCELNPLGKFPEDWWVHNVIAPVSKEKLGYDTQKPEALLERLILVASNPGDIVADFFLGGGTTIAVADRLDRNWIGTDINARAIQITSERLESQHRKIKSDFFVYGVPKSAKELKKLVDDNVLGEDKDSRHAFQDVITKYYLKNVVASTKKSGDDSIDGSFTFDFRGKRRTGLVQVTVTGNRDHLRKTCSHFGRGTADMVIYVTFQNTINNTLIKEAKLYGKLGGVDKVQLLSVEDLVDRGKQFELPKDENTLLKI